METPITAQISTVATALAKKDSYLGLRVEKEDFYGTVVFSGPLSHEGRPAGSENYLWLGIEWDDETRGRHNGTLNGTQYFETKENKNSGTLVKYDKVELGCDILDGILAKYFKENISKDLKESILRQIELKHASKAVAVVLSDAEVAQKKQQQQEDENPSTDASTVATSDESAQFSEGSTPTDSVKVASEEITAIARRAIQVEMDEDAYFETFKKHKKMVQFYGFDKIWERLSNLTELVEISLNKVRISDVGLPGSLGRLLPAMQTLSLENNLLFDWDQVFQIGYELPQLKSLSISSNFIRPLTASTLTRIGDKITCLKSGEKIENSSPMSVFPQLTTLIVIDCRINWQQVSRFLPAFPALEELFLCRNDMTDYENIDISDEDIARIKLLNLENTNQTDISGLASHLPRMKNLDKLLLNKNRLTTLGKLPTSGLETITQISLENNHFESMMLFSELAQFPNLKYLNIKHNPIGDKHGRSYVRQRAVATIQKLSIINGSELKKYERKDCEIYYMRRTFDDYFVMTGQVYYKYDLAQFTAWAAEHHPSHSTLMQKYGNPYEQLNEESQNITENSAPKNVMVALTLIAAAGPMLGKADKVKKFPDNTTVLSLKNVISKLYSIPNDKLIIKYRVNKHDPNEILDEDHKQIGFYGVRDGSMLIIDQQE